MLINRPSGLQAETDLLGREGRKTKNQIRDVQRRPLPEIWDKWETTGRGEVT